MVVRLSQVIDIDLLPNIEIHHSLFLFNDSIDREQNSTLHGSVISIFTSLFDCKLSEFDMNFKNIIHIGFSTSGEEMIILN